MTDQLNLFDASAKLAAEPETLAQPHAPQAELPAAPTDVNPADMASGLPPEPPPAASGPADDIPSPADYAARRYLEYAMSVVTGRALPSAADGQKPVQRRILYAMHR
ncbi:MAG TPA: DNA gyrase subunit A, partial [Azonexus sp.]